MQFGTALLDLVGKGSIDAPTTLVAVVASNHVLEVATGAANRQFPARHGNKEPLAALDDPDITDDKAVVKGHTAESLELVLLGPCRTDSNFSNFQGGLTFMPPAQQTEPFSNRTAHLEPESNLPTALWQTRIRSRSAMEPYGFHHRESRSLKRHLRLEFRRRASL